MKVGFTLLLTFIVMLSSHSSHTTDECECYKTYEIEQQEFSPSVPINPRLVPIANFKRLNNSENKTLWFEEIKFPLKTLYTSLWDDYSPNNYHTSHHNFTEYFKYSGDVELAFQFGPNTDLWAYHTFVISKRGSCYLAVRTYFRHARFTNKSYSMMCPSQVDSLRSILEKLPQKQTSEGYRGSFRDNRKDSTFCVSFNHEVQLVPLDTIISQPSNGSIDTTIISTSEYTEPITKLFEFVDHKIIWVDSYSL